MTAGAFCTDCGARMVGGICPTHGAPSETVTRRPTVFPLLTFALASLGTVLAAAALVIVLTDETAPTPPTDTAELDPAILALPSAVAALEDREAEQDQRMAAVESALAEPTAPPLTELASTLRRSVVTVEAAGGIGSGFAIRNAIGEVVIITNYHVVAGAWDRGARDVTLIVGDSRYPGTIDRVSSGNDLASVATSAAIPPLTARAEPAIVGEPVVAMGSPYGLKGTLTTGVVSAIREGRIQFSAPVSPGSSGGPLVDASGRLIGVVVEKVAGVGFEGLSFAIPVDVVCSTLTSCEG